MKKKALKTSNGPINISDVEPSDHPNRLFTFTLNYYGMQIRECCCAYTPKGELHWGNPCDDHGVLFFNDKAGRAIQEKLGNVVIPKNPKTKNVDTNSEIPF